VAYAGRWPGDPPEGEPQYRLPDGFQKSLVAFNLHRFPLFRADRHTPLILVEGYWSVFRLHRLGYQAVALMGRDLSARQEELLAVHADRVVAMMDGDQPGREAQPGIVNRPAAGRLWVRAVELPDGEQPDTIRRRP
jgi:DNA primase